MARLNPQAEADEASFMFSAADMARVLGANKIAQINNRVVGAKAVAIGYSRDLAPIPPDQLAVVEELAGFIINRDPIEYDDDDMRVVAVRFAVSILELFDVKPKIVS